jgi:hypothetical protein
VPYRIWERLQPTATASQAEDHQPVHETVLVAGFIQGLQVQDSTSAADILYNGMPSTFADDPA